MAALGAPRGLGLVSEGSSNHPALNQVRGDALAEVKASGKLAVALGVGRLEEPTVMAVAGVKTRGAGVAPLAKGDRCAVRVIPPSVEGVGELGGGGRGESPVLSTHLDVIGQVGREVMLSPDAHNPPEPGRYYHEAAGNDNSAASHQEPDVKHDQPSVSQESSNE